jgi:hypothetical protein
VCQGSHVVLSAVKVEESGRWFNDKNVCFKR